MDEIQIKKVENGFIVCENTGPHMMGKQWVFETPKGLSGFILGWANKQIVTDKHKEDEVKCHN